MFRHIFYLIFLSLSVSGMADHVVCIHGFLRSKRVMNAMCSALKREGHTPFAYSYASRAKTIEEHGADLAHYVHDLVKEHPSEQIHFVTHSMGGLVLRAAMNHPDFPEEGKSGTAILIAPPNKGSSFARRLHSYGPARFILGDKSGKQLLLFTENNIVELGSFPKEYPVLVIAGTKGWNPFLKGIHDGKVLVEETWLETPHDKAEVHARHPFICSHPRVIEKTVEFIQKFRGDMTYKTTYLKDYRKPDFTISDIHLTFDLNETKTMVTNTMKVKRVLDEVEELELFGEDIELVSVTINGEKGSYDLDEKKLVIHNVPAECEITIVNTLNPKENSRLEGLYMSSGMFCTQNEPHGFRRITYSLDRPDVMAKYTTKIIADKDSFPILLSNGNCIDSGDIDTQRHFAVWEDPFPKPSYLFALVGGDLEYIEDFFTTMSGRKVVLRIYSEEKYLSRLHHAMESLKKSMKWDEEVFGLEYDLDIFMIVAVDSFNAGAMENKGLNIFNTSCVLADPETETDDNFLRVEGVVAHEYFHNWTGDRVTCRDWFQLTLKEGLTVFRDQEFSADMNSRGVKRIQDAVEMRNRQFLEDAGPTSHPIKPDSYIEINNFYTATVYEKGAEVIRMIHTLLGKDEFRKGIDTYFKLYDGQAVTTEDFVHAMEISSGRDLSQFRRWYSQKGTPVLEVRTQYDEPTGIAYLSVRQLHLTERGQEPYHFPFSIAIFDAHGKLLREEILEITQEEENFTFENIQEPPVFSLNRNFSAPVIIHSDQTEKGYAALLKCESDPFARWEAGQQLALLRIHNALKNGIRDGREIAGESFTRAYGSLLADDSLDRAFKALCLTLPSETEIGLSYDTIDFDAIHQVREALLHYLATTYQDVIYSKYAVIRPPMEYRPTPEQVGMRKLRQYLLGMIRRLGDVQTVNAHYQNATNMTDRFGALCQLTHFQGEEKEAAFADFHARGEKDLLTFNKYLVALACSTAPDTLERVQNAVSDPIYDMNIPNMNRSLFAAFSQNYPQFHKADGSGYAFMADVLLKLDTINPAGAARIASGFKMYDKLDPNRRELMGVQLHRMLETEGLSENLYEVLSKTYQGK